MSAALGFVAIVVLFVAFFVILPQVSMMFESPEANTAVTLADQIKSMPMINDRTCQGVSSAVANTLTIMQDMDHTIGTGFGAVRIPPAPIKIGYLSKIL